MTNVKHTLITFFDIRGRIHHEFVEPGTTMNALYYKTVLQKVKKVVKKKRGSDHHWFLHHFLRGYIKNQLFQHYPISLGHMETLITETIQ